TKQDEQGNIDSEDQVKFLKFLFNIVITKPNNQTIRKKSIRIKEISKKVPRWSYKLIDDLEQWEGENKENVTAKHEICSRKSKRIVIFTNNQANADTYTNTKDANDPDQTDEVALIHYSQQSDFWCDIIKCSIRAQRRKTIPPFFLDRGVENKQRSGDSRIGLWESNKSVVLLGETVKCKTLDGGSPIAESITSLRSDPSSMGHVESRVNQ
ncbi:hypothetical protein E1A91_D12G102000v1, partial [Gossypium mustelinum]